MRSSKSIMTGVAVLAALALPMVAGADTNKLVVRNAGDTANALVVTDGGKIGINVTPTYMLHLIGSGDATTGAGIFALTGRTSVSSSDSPGFSFMRNNVSSVNGGLPRAGDRLGYFGFGSFISGGYKWLTNIAVFAESNANTSGAPTYLTFSTSGNALTASEQMRITSAGNVGIGTTAPKSKLHVTGIVEYVDNAAAAAAGLTAGAIYRTGDVLKIVH